MSEAPSRSGGLPQLLRESLNRRDVRQLIVITVLASVAAGWSTLDLKKKRALLEPMVETCVSQLLSEEDRTQLEILTEFESGREYGWFGKYWGLVRIYTRLNGDESMESFHGIEYFYQLENGAWVQKDSSSVVEPQRKFDGMAAFEKAGYTVSEAAYVQ